MSDYIISCESVADLTNEHLSRINVHYCKMPYSIDNNNYFDDLGQTVPYDKFYEMIKQDSTTSTSQLNAEGYKKYFKEFLDKGLDIIHIVLSSGLTGTINSCNVAAQELMEEYPNSKIYVVDSLGASGGLGMIVDTLARLKSNGKTIEQLYSWIEENKLKMNYLVFTTDLKYFVKGGRVSKTAGAIGGALQICPILHMDPQGKLIVIDKVRGKKAVIKSIVDRMENLCENGLNYDKQVYINHADSLDDALEVKRLIEERFKNLKEEIVINYIGTTIGSHTGPGTVSLYFWGKENRK